MPYAVVYAWEGGKPARNAKWTLGAAEEAMLDSLRAANARGGELDIRVIDRATGETVVEPQRCAVCRDKWATEVSHIDGGYTLCGECDEDDLPADEPTPVPAGLTDSLVAALRSQKLGPVPRPDGTVTVRANDMDWTLKPVPHAVTGEPCGVWSAIGPGGPRGQFVARNAAGFIAQRRVP